MEKSAASSEDINIELKGEINECFNTEKDDVVTDDDKMKQQEVIKVDDEEEEFILSKLREVVRKCNLADPNKRPTAHEVLTILTRERPSTSN